MGHLRLPDARGAGRAAAFTLLTLLVAAEVARAETLVLTLDPEATEIAFQLGATLHTVEGSLALRSGRVEFPEEGGAASGRIVVVAASAQTGLDSRDAEMHARVLLSSAHPDIAFAPTFVQLKRRDDESADIVLRGRFEILGTQHPVELPARVESVAPGRVRAQFRAQLPYVAWGLEDVSNFVLRVDDEVSLIVNAEGTLTPVGAAPADP